MVVGGTVGGVVVGGTVTVVVVGGTVVVGAMVVAGGACPRLGIHFLSAGSRNAQRMALVPTLTTITFPSEQ